MNRDELRRVVKEEVLRSLGLDAPSPAAAEPVPPPAPSIAPQPPEVLASPAGAVRAEENVARWLRQRERAPRKRPPIHPFSDEPGRPDARAERIPEPANPAMLRRVLAASPSRLGVGRIGTRYLTEVYLQMRADHAIAKDAVYSESSDALVEKLGCIALRTRCKDRENYLLYPDQGRRLDDESTTRLQQQGTRGADVQLIVGDGLSAWAAELNAVELLPLLTSGLNSAGFSVGRPLFVRFARVGVQDHIGTLLGAKATVIMLGERPGLGTGDSLSIYIAYGPKLDQDNAEKNCISNVRPLGIRPPEAARLTVEVLRRAFAAGRGGVSRS